MDFPSRLLKGKVTALCLLFCLISASLSAQDTITTKEVQPISAKEYRELTCAGVDWKYCTSYLKDSRDILIAPAHWNGKQWLGFAGVTLATGGLMLADDEIQSFAQRNRTNTTNSISHYGLEPWGNWYIGGVIVGIYLHGVIWDNDHSKRSSLLATKAFLLAAVFTRIPKYAFQRLRPGTFNHDQFIFQGPFGNYKNTSFFSGHTSSVFAAATVLASEYKDTKWVSPVAYTIAALTGLSRIHDNRHWASDVLAGAAFGYAIGKLVHNQDNWGVKVGVVSTDDGLGMGLVIPLN